MSSVELKNVTKKFKNITALDDISFMVRDQEFFVLLGPTGAGKTTTLRVISALLRQDEGDVYFDGELVNDWTPADRDVAFVFQQYSLYPTMTVFDNLAFPLRSPMRKTSKAEIEEKVGYAAEILHISHLLDRKTARLSGGEMQRVAIGRAIVREPRIFLMDEPLSNLDAKLREALRVELQHMQKTQGNTTLFVTHDQVEALTMADRIGVLDEGRIIQVGPPIDIYDRPATTFVATLVGSPRINLYEANKQNDILQIANSELQIPCPVAQALPEKVQIGIRPEDILPAEDGQFAGEIKLTEPLGVETVLHIRSGEQTLLSLIPGISRIRMRDTIRFSILTDRLHYFDNGGKRIN